MTTTTADNNATASADSSGSDGPRVLIVRTAGTNCDRELAHAFSLAGAHPTSRHLNALIDDPAQIADYDILGLPGGFSYGDDIAAGRILANRLRHRLLDQLTAAIARGVPVIGICNGFQVLVKLGLLPDPTAASQQVTLTLNTFPRFVARWVKLQANTKSPCIWTKGVKHIDLPIAHGQGRLAGPEDVIETLEANGQIALTYDSDDNPNGSERDIAGICDPTGLVLGLMPHPERYTAATNHPAWTSQAGTPTLGLSLFENAVKHVVGK